MLSFQFLPFNEIRSNYQLIKAEEFQQYHRSFPRAPKFLIDAYQFMDDLFSVLQHSFTYTPSSTLSSESLKPSKIIVGAMKLLTKLEELEHSVFNTNINKMINATENNKFDKKSALEAAKALREFKLKNNMSQLQRLKCQAFLQSNALNGLDTHKKNPSVQEKFKFAKPNTLHAIELSLDQIIKREFSKTKEFVLPCDVPQKAT